MSGKLFGTDGVRGVANRYPMTADFAVKLGMACGTEICKVYRKVAIARDTRISGEMLQSALASGFLAAGVDVIELGILPTPALTAVTADLDVDMSVMITASHNPYYDNGIKLITASGDKFDDEVTSRLEQLVADGNFELSSEKLGRIYANKEALVMYLEKAKSFIDTPHPLKGMKIVLDCANGCFAGIMPQVFKDLGAGIITIGNEPDGYNINRDCGSQHPEKMYETVVGSHADIGIAVDGDGDRLLVCDNNGHKIAAEQLIAFLANYLKSKGKYRGNAVVSTIIANTALERYIRGSGFDYYSTKVGERAIIAKMKEAGCSLGGEESGHIVALDYCKSGDGMVNALLVCLALADSGKKADEVFPVFEADACVFVSVAAADRQMVSKAAASDNIRQAVAEAESLLNGSGRVVLHPSGTEPKIRVWVSGSDETLVRKASEKVVGEVKKFVEE